MKISELKVQFPVFISKWENGKDVRFPNGENTKDVKKRMINFCKKLSKELSNLSINKSVLIVTHNVFLRCLLGHFYAIDIKWHLIKIKHLKEIKFIFLKII